MLRQISRICDRVLMIPWNLLARIAERLPR